jgi:hypothetical protein
MYIQVIDNKLRGFEDKYWSHHLIFNIQSKLSIKQYVSPKILININMKKKRI